MHKYSRVVEYAGSVCERVENSTRTSPAGVRCVTYCSSIKFMHFKSHSQFVRK